MPGPVLPPELRSTVSMGVRDLKAHLDEPAGRGELAALNQVRMGLTADPGRGVKPQSMKAATGTLALIGTLPADLVSHADAPLLDPGSLTDRQALTAGAAAAQVLALGAESLLTGVRAEDSTPDSIVHAALGADRLSVAVRRAVVDPKLPLGLPPKVGIDLATLTKLGREGALRDYLDAFRRCGMQARTDRAWLAAAGIWGQVKGLDPATACAGDKLRIEFTGFGATAPDPTQVGDILVAIPIGLGSFTHISLRQTNPGLFQAGGWSDSGSVTVILPQDVTSGPVAFVAIPPPQTGGGTCQAGDMSSAAGAMAEVLGPILGQRLVTVAATVEAQRFGELPGAEAQADGANLLTAGPPLILSFRVVDLGWVHPRGTVTIEWSTANATTIEIVAMDAPGTLNPHELPPIAGPLPASGRLTVAVPCTRRWEGEYVLRATNATTCGQQPVEATVPVTSGWSHYRVGAAKVDITPREPGLGMAGFAYKYQATGTPAVVHSPLYARAFVIAENVASSGSVVGLVVADIWTCTIRLKAEVLRRLRPGSPFTDANLVIAGTHTHSAPGGYSDYALYNLSVGEHGGLRRRSSIGMRRASPRPCRTRTVSSAPGRVLVNSAELEDCGANRSFEAFRRNPEFANGQYEDPSQWTDREMLLLALHQDTDNRGGSRPVGAVNWFALHPTSLGMYNAQISGDSKGRAGEMVEATMAARTQGFVAAFGNGNAGDVSGNVTLDAAGRSKVRIPEGGQAADPVQLQGGVLLLPRVRNRDQSGDLARLEDLARRQADHAQMLLDTATVEVSGPIRARHQWVDMSGVQVPGVGSTAPAAIGVSFGAGSSEDSFAVASIGPVDMNPGIVEGITHGEMVAGGAIAVVTLALPAPGLLATLLLGAPLVPAAVAALVPALGTALVVLNASPAARAFVFGGVGALAFPGQLNEQAPAGWSWELPGPLALPPAYVAGHGDKPIMFPVGLATLVNTATGDRSACPLVPHVLPVQLVSIGSVAIAGVPAEFTATAGRRIKDQVRSGLGAGVTHVAVSNYTNGYSGYVTTAEEYSAQHYEGASTLYGPNTLEAYELAVAGLAAAVAGNAKVEDVSSVPSQAGAFAVPAVYEP